MNAAKPIDTVPPNISASPAIVTMCDDENAPAIPEVTANDATSPSLRPSMRSRTQLPPAA